MISTLLQNDVATNNVIKKSILTALKSASAVDIAVSYLRMSGWSILKDPLVLLTPGKVRLLATDQMNITQPAVLDAAIKAGMLTKCYRGNRTYHPKVYIIHGTSPADNVIIVGSSNISESALVSGIEAGIKITGGTMFAEVSAWFNTLWSDTASETVDEAFITAYSTRWKPASQERARWNRQRKTSKTPKAYITPEDEEVLDDVFSTITLPVGTLGFDHSGNNIRNLARFLSVLKKHPQLSSKESSELRLLGCEKAGKLTVIGKKLKGIKSTVTVARQWCSWIKGSDDAELIKINARLGSFNRAADRFWKLKPAVRKFFFTELQNRKERPTLQAIELCCNGSPVVESFDLEDFRDVAKVVARGKNFTEFIRNVITDYQGNKGSRSWGNADRKTMLNAWEKS